MKKILFLFLILSNLCYAQTPETRTPFAKTYTPIANSWAWTNNGIIFDSFLKSPSYINLDSLKFITTNSQGKFILKTIPKSFDTISVYAKIKDDSIVLDTKINTKQNQINGTGFVKASGTTISYDNTSYYPASNPNSYISSYTETDPLFDTKLLTKTTSDLTEGSNLYYTSTRVQSVIDADTGRGVGNLATGGSLNKVKDSLAALIGGGGVSVASVSEVNTGTDNAKFVSPLAIQGSKYLDQTSSKIAGLTSGTSTAYVLNTTPSFTPGTWTMLNVKFHATNTGAATINVNGSGAVALQKDLSTALVANDIPINSEYQLLRTSTGWLVKDIGFAGINTSARFFASISDETGGTLVVGSASPTFTGTPAAPTAAAGTNTTQIATTAHVFAERTNTATLTNKTITSPSIATPLVTGLSSGTTNDSLLVADPSTGAVRRISSARIGGGGGGLSGLTPNNVPKATSSTTIGTSQITDNGTSVGINNASPLADCKLQVTTSTPFSTNGGDLRIDNSSSDAASITLNSTAVGGQRYSIFSASGAFGATGSFGIYDHTSGIRLLKANGAQDIGTFHVRGNNAGASSITIENTATGGTAWSLLTNANSSGRGGEFNLFNGAYRMTVTASGQMSVGSTAPTTNAMLDVQSTSKGILPPRMTSAQRAATSWGANDNGMLIICTDCTATDGSTGVLQMYQHTTTSWKNAF